MRKTLDEYAEEIAQSSEVRNVAFELIRLWRMNWDIPGSSGYQSYIMRYRQMCDLLPGYRGSMVTLAKAVLAIPRENSDVHSS